MTTTLLLAATRSWGAVFGLLVAALVVLVLGVVALVVARRGR